MQLLQAALHRPLWWALRAQPAPVWHAPEAALPFPPPQPGGVKQDVGHLAAAWGYLCQGRAGLRVLAF